MSNLQKSKHWILMLIAFVMLFLSYAFNFWEITDNGYRTFDRSSEGNIIGRLILSQQEGVFSHGAITGHYLYYEYDSCNFEKGKVVTPYMKMSAEDRAQVTYEARRNHMYDDYINDRKIEEGVFVPYKTQTGGQAIVYGLLQKVLPISNAGCLNLFRLLTIALTVLCFTLFIGWISREFGMLPAIITFILILLSAWPMRFGFSIWWVLWSYYIPFIVTLLVLERRDRKSLKLFDNKLILLFGITVFIKCFFSGCEYITSALVTSMCPIIYYLIKDNTNLKFSILFFLKSSLASIVAVIASFLVIIVQIKFLDGTFADGVNHLVSALFRRSLTSEDMGDVTIFQMLSYYMGENSFYLNHFPNFRVPFGALVGIISLFCLIIFILNKKLEVSSIEFRKNIALIATTIISIAGPLSWICIFSEHALSHIHWDYVVWYMPYLLLGFATIGVGLNIIVQQISTRIK